MKKTLFTKRILQAGVALSIIVAATTFEPGCTKSKSSTTTQDTLSSATMATSIGNLVTSPQSGIAPQAEANASMYQSMNFACGYILDTTFSGSTNVSGMSMNYQLTYADTAFCGSGSTLTKVDFYMKSYMNMTMTGLYEGDAAKTFMSMSGLDTASTNFVLNESCSSLDTIKETSPTALTCYVSMTYGASNITISKSTNQIVSGTATVQYAYTTGGGNSYNVSATVRFLGNRQATITLANGYVSTVSW